MIRYFLIIGLVLITSIGRSQDNAIGLWTGVAVDKTLIKDVDLLFNVQHRWDDDLQHHDATFVQGGIEYKATDLIRLTGEYRASYYSWNQPQESFGHRYNFDVGLNNVNELISDSIPFDLDIRLRVQYETAPTGSNELYSRFRGKVSYDIPGSDITAYALFEGFYHFGHYTYYTENQVSTAGLFDKWRVRTGLNYDLPKGQSIRVFYLYQRFTEQLRNEHIFGISYAISLKGRLIK